jgi:Cu/Ag efflux pump CusA
VLQAPKRTLVVAAVLLVLSLWPLQHISGTFMPQLDEGDLLFIPSALPGLSAAKAAQLLQQTDRPIKTVPDLLSVYGTQVIAAQPLHRAALQLRARGGSPPVLISAQTASVSTADLQSAQRSARARHRWAPH